MGPFTARRLICWRRDRLQQQDRRGQPERGDEYGTGTNRVDAMLPAARS
jgi:hypothetical protein